ncbi:hypothetical protein GCM10025868_13200 [Angustibacter aerolatus]|uniref:Glycosyltransferase 2-like domain-containing protein n=1 Tax=Angustibacter aerolatus TaxID=1162965 RepID=A0ABQ6JD12_9ACTN|nr:glycosyltransferase [Angustibacter aerolatus]GMA86070.1 hypothetical protein GCM10025868_13200 [Angustibacter aerolatus]
MSRTTSPTAPTRPDRLDAEVVIPVRWDRLPAAEHAAEVEAMAGYLRGLSGLADVTVVDGSCPDRFAEHARAWAPSARHVAPTGGTAVGVNGKVVGAMTGVLLARHERVVLADDDVRYDRDTLTQVVRLLDDADLVRPQNVFSQWPWHARWDGARQARRPRSGR